MSRRVKSTDVRCRRDFNFILEVGKHTLCGSGAYPSRRGAHRYFSRLRLRLGTKYVDSDIRRQTVRAHSTLRVKTQECCGKRAEGVKTTTKGCHVLNIAKGNQWNQPPHSRAKTPVATQLHPRRARCPVASRPPDLSRRTPRTACHPLLPSSMRVAPRTCVLCAESREPYLKPDISDL